MSVAQVLDLDEDRRMKEMKRKDKTKRDRIYTYTCRFAVFAGIVMIFVLGMAIDTTDISEADLTLWGVSSLVLMVLGAIGMRAEE